ncbi:MAG: hypothetical protein ACQEVQ_03900 [Pseudomonadota bacterium]
MSNSWFDKWGVWLAAVLSLIFFGALISQDVHTLTGITNAITASGTILLGFTAVMALEAWKKQEKTKFQAKCAATIYSELHLVKGRLYGNKYIFLKAREMTPDNNISRHDIEKAKASAQETLRERYEELRETLSNSVAPSAIMLGAEFSEEISNLLTESLLLSTQVNWNEVESDRLNNTEAKLSELLDFLSQVALFQRQI